MQGLHLTADLRGCQPADGLMRDTVALRRLCLAVVAEAGLQAVGELFHAFTPEGSGVTGVVLLAESHLAVHTWPEIDAVTLDVYVCNLGADNSTKAQALLQRLEAAFQPASAQRHQLMRGDLAPSSADTRRPAVMPSANASSKTE
jgi:S-adenosylmethionine decarboxylase